MQKAQQVLDFCKYYDNGKCPYRKACSEKVDELEKAGIPIGSLQPRCPKDAQRDKRGLLRCVCERRNRLC